MFGFPSPLSGRALFIKGVRVNNERDHHQIFNLVRKDSHGTTVQIWSYSTTAVAMRPQSTFIVICNLIAAPLAATFKLELFAPRAILHLKPALCPRTAKSIFSVPKASPGAEAAAKGTQTKTFPAIQACYWALALGLVSSHDLSTGFFDMLIRFSTASILVVDMGPGGTIHGQGLGGSHFRRVVRYTLSILTRHRHGNNYSRFNSSSQTAWRVRC